jgi:hypothetical protein
MINIGNNNFNMIRQMTTWATMAKNRITLVTAMATVLMTKFVGLICQDNFESNIKQMNSISERDGPDATYLSVQN